MWNENFYPTPKSLAMKVFEHYGIECFWKNTMMLEPSAGKGDFIDAFYNFYKQFDHYYNDDNVKKYISGHVHCIEIEPELQNILRGKGYNLIASDFLKYVPDEKYNFIFMNPPFSDAYKHLIHAWEIVDDGGDIACILPSNYEDNHPKINYIMENCVSVEECGSAFTTDETFRKTSVNVSIYYFKKPISENEKFEFENNFEKDNYVNFKSEDSFNGEIAMRDEVGNYVTAYNKIIELFSKISDLSAEYSHYIKYFDKSVQNDDFFIQSIVDMARIKDRDIQRGIYNNYVKEVKNIAWNKIFKLTEIESIVTKQVKDDFGDFCKQQSNISFSKENIYNLIKMMYGSQGEIKKRCISESFNKLTSFHEKNKVYFEGWKTNSFYKVNKKVIIPYGMSSRDIELFGRPYINYYHEDDMNDIDKSLCFLSGKKFKNIKGIVKTIREDVKEFGKWYESEFFMIKCFMKGTIHLTFKDLDLLAKFNMEAVKDKWNWVGTDNL